MNFGYLSAWFCLLKYFSLVVSSAKPRALISVSDKTNLDKLAFGLVALGFEVISTGGSAKFIQDKNIPVTSVDSVTSFPEMLDGRVKTLHPGIHGGILARRENETHMKQISEHNIDLIDVVVVRHVDRRGKSRLLNRGARDDAPRQPALKAVTGLPSPAVALLSGPREAETGRG